MSFLKNRKVANIFSILLVAIFAVAFYMSYMSGAEATVEPNDHVHPALSWGGVKNGAGPVFHAGVSSNCNASHTGSHMCGCSDPCGC